MTSFSTTNVSSIAYKIADIGAYLIIAIIIVDICAYLIIAICLYALQFLYSTTVLNS